MVSMIILQKFHYLTCLKKSTKNFNNNQLRINKEIANLGTYNVKSDERK